MSVAASNALGAPPGDALKVAETILGLMPEAGVMVIDTDMRVAFMNGGAYARHGYDASTVVGRDLRDVLSGLAWSKLGDHWLAALAGEACTLDPASTDAQREYGLHFAPVRTTAGVVGAIMIAQDITELVRGREQLRHRLTQQAAVSAFGSLAIQGRPVAELLAKPRRSSTRRSRATSSPSEPPRRVSRRSARAPERFRPSRRTRPSPELRRAIRLVCDAGETLLSPDLSSEKHFRAPGLQAAGMVSLVAAPMGSASAAFGEMVACSRQSPRSPRTISRSSSRSRTCSWPRSNANAPSSRAAVAESRMSEFWQLSNDLLAVFTPEGASSRPAGVAADARLDARAS